MILNVRTVDNIDAKSLDLSYEVGDFKQLCYNWEKYVDGLNETCALSIQHVRK